ncbi:MAG: hypothetical protein ACYDHH_28730 [Solirubrobacteraceae bacterium]
MVPREWLGSTDELVPFGPGADRRPSAGRAAEAKASEAEAPARDAPSPDAHSPDAHSPDAHSPDAQSFWSADAASLHEPIDAGLEPRPARRRRVARPAQPPRGIVLAGLATAVLLVVLSILGGATGGSQAGAGAHPIGPVFLDVGQAPAAARGAAALAAAAETAGAEAIRRTEQSFAVMTRHLERLAVAQASAERRTDAHAQARGRTLRAATLGLQRGAAGSSSAQVAVSSPVAASSPPVLSAPTYSPAASGGGASSGASGASSQGGGSCFPGDPGC